MRNIFVTGATGVIEEALVPTLVAALLLALTEAVPSGVYDIVGDEPGAQNK